MTPEAINELRAKLDAEALEALRAGMDWVEGPMQPGRIDPATGKPGIAVKAGPVAAGSDVPEGFRVIRNTVWVEAGRPGDKGAN